jgi:hypothetical protein
MREIHPATRDILKNKKEGDVLMEREKRVELYPRRSGWRELG